MKVSTLGVARSNEDESSNRIQSTMRAVTQGYLIHELEFRVTSTARAVLAPESRAPVQWLWCMSFFIRTYRRNLGGDSE